MPVHVSPRRLALAVALLCVVALGGARPASAGLLAPTAAGCPSEELSQPFLPWLDPAHYVLAPDGGFEAGAARWRLSGATIAPTNEPFYVRGSADRAALELQPGGRARSPAMCVGIEHPTLRLFARHDGPLLSTLRVDVLYKDALGTRRSLTIGRVLGSGQWSPTLPMPVVANLFALLPGERTRVVFRFTAVGPHATWQIDDVYVDPYRKG